MKKIRAINGKYIKVSDCDYDFLKQFRWCQGTKWGYYTCSQRGTWLGIEINAKTVQWFVMKLNGLEKPPHQSIDHINRNPADNTHENLRFATQSEQACNRGVRVDSKSGSLGVYPRGKNWRISLTVDGDRVLFGTYSTAEEAKVAYKKASQEYTNYQPPWSTFNLKRCTDLRLIRRIPASSYRGVKRSGKRWQAIIGVNYTQQYLGTFDTEIEASKAYEKAREGWDV